MKTKYFARAAAVAAGIGLSALPVGAEAVHAAPADPPPPCINCDPGPGGGPSGPSMNGPSMNSPGIIVPDRPGVEPPVGGGSKSGGRSVQQ